MVEPRGGPTGGPTGGPAGVPAPDPHAEPEPTPAPPAVGPADVAAVVVNYKSAELTVACVASLRAEGLTQIVVVDAASGDRCSALVAAADPAVRFVGLAVNRGYGAAANAGVAVTDGPAVLICNPDLVVRPGAVAALGAGLADPRVAVVGPRIDRPDGTRYPSARRFPSLGDAAGHGFVGLFSTENRWSRRYLRSDEEQPGAVDWVSGACLLVRRRAWEQVGGFDERYFMFMEDVDLCRRLHLRGWDVVFEPAARVTHLEGVSRATAPYRMIVAHHRSLLRYGWRSSAGAQRLALPLVAVGLAVRTVLQSLKVALARRRPVDGG